MTDDREKSTHCVTIDVRHTAGDYSEMFFRRDIDQIEKQQQAKKHGQDS